MMMMHPMLGQVGETGDTRGWGTGGHNVIGVAGSHGGSTR